MVVIQGQGVSEGIVRGRLFFFRHGERAAAHRPVRDCDAEWGRFCRAREEAVRQLTELAERARASAAGHKAGDDAAWIFESHRILAEDPEYANVVEAAIRGRNRNAGEAVEEASELFAGQLAASGDAYTLARAADVRDVAGRIRLLLEEQDGDPASAPETPVFPCGMGGSGTLSVFPREQSAGDAPPVFPEPVILAADDLAPSETLQLDRSKILGFVTSEGSAAGHTAILARTMGLPAVVAAGSALRPEYDGMEALMDGGTGELVVEPDAAACAEFDGRRQKREKEQAKLSLLREEPSRTGDGRVIRVCCNIGGPEDVLAVRDSGADGIGLFRSECLYLNRTDCPSEDAQFAAYRSVLAAMEGKRVVIRTLDAGSDKQAACLGLEREANPALGIRGLRLCLERPELFRAQLRALYRASVSGSLAILFPMVTSLWEVREAKRLCGNVRAELAAEGIAFRPDVPIGVMIETPAAALISGELAEEVDFFSCGTNDLTQYVLACDRSDMRLGRFCDLHHPAVLRLLAMTAESARGARIPVAVCGELAADMEMTSYLLSIGIDELSVPPGSVLPLRGRIRELAEDTENS